MEMGKREGAQGNFAFPLPLSHGTEEERGRSAPAPIPAPRGWGQKREGDEGIPSPFSPRAGMERGGPAAAALSGSGGGAREPGRRNAGAA